MKQDARRLSPEGLRHTFTVVCEGAQQVRLVIELRPGVSQIFPLTADGDGTWTTTLTLQPGTYRFCYHAYTGRTLTYITPPDHPIDGLKGVLRIGDSQEPHSAAHKRTDNAARRASLLHPPALDVTRGSVEAL